LNPLGATTEIAPELAVTGCHAVLYMGLTPTPGGIGGSKSSGSVGGGGGGVSLVSRRQLSATHPISGGSGHR